MVLVNVLKLMCQVERFTITVHPSYIWMTVDFAYGNLRFAVSRCANCTFSKARHACTSATLQEGRRVIHEQIDKIVANLLCHRH